MVWLNHTSIALQKKGEGILNQPAQVKKSMHA